MSKKKSGQAEFIKWFGPVLDALRALGGSAKPREIAEWIGKEYNIPDHILNARYEKSGQLKYPNQIAWARQYLVWDGLLDSSKHGVWTLTPKGWNAKLKEKQSHDILTGSFAKSAIEIEKSNIKLELVDGDKLVEMFENVELGVIPKTIYEPDMKFFEQYRDMK